MINYYCPGFAEAQPVYRLLLKLQKEYPEAFYPNVRISRIYGIFPNMIWNGGSTWNSNQLNPDQIIDIFNWYSKETDVTLQLNFTNPLLQEVDLYDRYCNTVLEIASHYDFIEILVSSPILEKYIREKYPNIKIDKSIIATTKNVMRNENDNFDYYMQDSEQYNKYVLPRKYVADLNFLNNIPKEKRDKFELLVNDPCPLNCPYLYDHYEGLAKDQLYLSKEEAGCKLPFSKQPLRFYTYRDSQYTYEQVCEIFEPLGFTEIKLSGRADMINVILSIVPYLIIPECHRDVYSLLLKRYKNGGVGMPDFRSLED